MSLSLAGFGFEKGYQPTSFGHNSASNDAVRILALFTCLAHTPSSGFKLDVECHFAERAQTIRPTKKAMRQKRKGTMLKTKKFIRDHYQFKYPEFQFCHHSFDFNLVKCTRANIRVADRKCPGPELDSPRKLEEVFSEYNIAAISQEGPHKSGHSPNRDTTYGHYSVGFESSDELARFMTENNERQLKCGRRIEIVQSLMPWQEPKDKMNTIVSAREKNKENLDRRRKDGFRLDFRSRMEAMSICS
ncbi:hypothetical protein GGR57DRAFT_508721 [Xylariaceae sp. FL1272]|nr:hypothetical protein GGR57DRAFT_508721 [Xylariaceae sp. FL1272]